MAFTSTPEQRKKVFNDFNKHKVISNTSTGANNIRECLEKDEFLNDIQDTIPEIKTKKNKELYDFGWEDIELLIPLYEFLDKQGKTYLKKNVEYYYFEMALHYALALCCIEIVGSIDTAKIEKEYIKLKTGPTIRVQMVRNAINIANGNTTSGVAQSNSSTSNLTEIAQECKELLEANHNIILSGAPGTGKTYMAKEIANEMCDNDESHIEFVQFHPSYDYTDFVEGLRPIKKEDTPNSSIGFKLTDGIFKEFCKKALTDTIKDGLTKIRQEISNGQQPPIKTKSGKEYKLSVGKNDIEVKVEDVEDEKEKVIDTISKTELKRIYNTDNPDPDNKESGKHKEVQEIRKEVLRRIISFTKYVFIIDEINRGEMSKVFGELFFSIDPGYRGTDGAVRTQYANMSGENEFDKYMKAEGKTLNHNGHFFVPENVYIIGTMNDIDRSVDTMDFAMRRRFLIKEIKAKDTQYMLSNADVIQRMDALNDVIEGGENSSTKINAKLGSAYSLGASYFKKIEQYEGENKYEELWSNHLEGILREYLRGTQKPEEDLGILKRAYDSANDTANTNANDTADTIDTANVNDSANTQDPT